MTTVSAAFTAAKCTPRAVARSAKGPAAALRAPARPLAATMGNRARLAKISRSAAPRSRVVVRAQTPSWHPDANPADEDPDAPTPGFASIDEAIADWSKDMSKLAQAEINKRLWETAIDVMGADGLAFEAGYELRQSAPRASTSEALAKYQFLRSRD